MVDCIEDGVMNAEPLSEYWAGDWRSRCALWIALQLPSELQSRLLPFLWSALFIIDNPLENIFFFSFFFLINYPNNWLQSINNSHTIHFNFCAPATLLPVWCTIVLPAECRAILPASIQVRTWKVVRWNWRHDKRAADVDIEWRSQ